MSGSMREVVGGVAVLWCAMTYWLGGQELPGLNRGFKWIRRFAMPLGLFFALLVLSSERTLQSSLHIGLCMALLSGACHFGYQASVWKYALVGLLLGLPAVVLLHPHWTSLLPCVFHAGFGIVSLKDNKFGWSMVAILTGTSIGIAYVTSVNAGILSTFGLF